MIQVAEIGEYVGVVNGVEEATTQRFQVVLDAAMVVQLDDILVCRQQLPNGTSVDHYGIVLEIVGGLEGAKFASDTERVMAGTTPGLKYRVATVQILRSTPELWIPPEPGARVYRAQGEAREIALFRDQMDNSDLNIGLDGTGQPVPIDFRFFNGELGGHASISGISGVATKTSFAMHMLYMMLESPRGQQLLGEHLTGTRCVLFNVKGEDLLHLDRANSHFNDRQETIEEWRALGVERPAPFRSVAYYVPPQGHETLRTGVVSRGTNAYTTFGISPREFVRRGLLSFVFNESNESLISHVIENVRLKLLQHCMPLADGSVVIRPQIVRPTGDLEHAADEFNRSMHGTVAPGDFTFRAFSDLVTFLTQHADVTWQATMQQGTWDAFLRRIQGMTGVSVISSVATRRRSLSIIISMLST